MTVHHDDVLDRLRAADPVRAGTVTVEPPPAPPDVHASPRLTHIDARPGAEPDAGDRAPRRLELMVAAAITLLVVAAAGSAVGVLAIRRATSPGAATDPTIQLIADGVPGSFRWTQRTQLEGGAAGPGDPLQPLLSAAVVDDDVGMVLTEPVPLGEAVQFSLYEARMLVQEEQIAPDDVLVDELRLVDGHLYLRVSTSEREAEWVRYGGGSIEPIIDAFGLRVVPPPSLDVLNDERFVPLDEGAAGDGDVRLRSLPIDRGAVDPVMDPDDGGGPDKDLLDFTALDQLVPSNGEVRTTAGPWWLSSLEQVEVRGDAQNRLRRLTVQRSGADSLELTFDAFGDLAPVTAPVAPDVAGVRSLLRERATLVVEPMGHDGEIEHARRLLADDPGVTDVTVDPSTPSLTAALAADAEPDAVVARLKWQLVGAGGAHVEVQWTFALEAGP